MPHRVLGSAAREFRDVLRGATATHRRLRDHLVTITTVGVDVFCAIVAVLLERHFQADRDKDIGRRCVLDDDSASDGFLVAQEPDLGGGRILDVLMEIYAITVIAGLAGAIGTFFQNGARRPRTSTERPATRAGPTGHPITDQPIPPAATRTVDPRLRRLGGVSSEPDDGECPCSG